MQTLSCCRICGSQNLTEVVNLGSHVITSRFPDIGDTSTPVTPIRLLMCDSCSLVQLGDTVNSSELYEHMYGYRSGLNEMMRKHLADYATDLIRIAEPSPGDYVLDIGSNDATFLKNYNSEIHRVGCDPTGTQFAEYYASANINLLPTYFNRSVIASHFGDTVKFRAVSSISMFYDLPDPVQFARDIHDCLEDDGVWTLEQSYVATMLNRNSIDTICHEHLEYYGVKQIKSIMDRADFKIIDISLNECNGGSFRIYVAKQTSKKYAEAEGLIRAFLEAEEAAGIHTPQRYVQFVRDYTVEIAKLRAFINAVNADGKRVYIYGASTKGNCLLQVANIGPNLIPYAVERNPLKYGKMTSTGIPIISEEQMRRDNPEYLLVLPWHFKEGIISRESQYLSTGGQLLFPFPTFDLHSSKPRALITGCDGQIATPLIQELSDSYTLFGLTHSIGPGTNPNITRIQYDALSLEQVVLTVKPVAIVHLASNTLTEACEKDPLGTMGINGLMAGRLCDIIHRNRLKCKLFNASSSELYRGHIVYTVKENDNNMLPTTAYGVAKEYSHRIVDYYRKKYGYSFSNGVIFTTESRLRKPHFLLRKICLHARDWHTTRTVLHLGSLDSYRVFIHANDVASAIHRILAQPYGDNYNICGEEIVKVEDTMLRLYALHGIQLEKKGSQYVDTTSGAPVVEVGAPIRPEVTNISGECTRLKDIGWSPVFSFDRLLVDLARMD
jgi:GDP-D-mannose dehydratase